MTYFTILAFFTASGDLINDPQSHQNFQACSDAMEQYVYLPEYKNIDMFCIETDIVSTSIKPRYRPE